MLDGYCWMVNVGWLMLDGKCWTVNVGRLIWLLLDG